MKRTASEWFEMHESVFLWRVDTEGGDARSSGLQPPSSEKRKSSVFNEMGLIDFDSAFIEHFNRRRLVCQTVLF